MIIDCGSCAVRDVACGDCVVSVLLGPPGETAGDGAGRPAAPVLVPAGPARTGPVELEEPERQALEALAESGLVPPLRLVSEPGPDRSRPRRPRAASA